MEVFDIREAKRSDAKKLIVFMRRILEDPNVDHPASLQEYNMTPRRQRKIIDRVTAEENSLFLVVEAEGRIIGTLRCDGGRLKSYLHRANLGMSVDLDWRGRGVGSALMGRAIEWAERNQWIRKIELNVFAGNQPAIHLYQKFGFELEGRCRDAVYRNGEYQDELVMALIMQKA